MKEVNIIIPEDLVTINRMEYDFLLNERHTNKELKQRINKALNYIESNMIEQLGGEIINYKISQIDAKELLNMLKGE